ncbi:antibiotic biosynthesis monooxygenase [Streptomyces sp. N2-109]|uniref:Antibiotic biosynthesis monooxygenase n=1 Tax=Streptomyces gossypii TaxID=2883101 RepID=A0ABT2JY53_9ACTN|nr:antibiotic biosynthesis monooxygenase [Streptomyces gossypii]MCT2592822.1 antibiotic biosynthesis monooxygenase [Streptomyces gossypii]
MIVTDGLVQQSVPDVLRPDAGLVLMSQWDVPDGPERRRTVMDGTIEAWEQHPLPEGFLSRVAFEGTDQKTIFNYAQWTSVEAHREFAQNPANQEGLTPRIVAIAGPVGTPGKYELYRSLRAKETPAVPGCIVAVTFDTDGPETARKFVDTLVEHFGEEQPGNEDGGIASHFHIHLDGSRVVNYSEWTSPEAHEEMVRTQLQEGSEIMKLVGSIEGLHPQGFRRFLPYRGLYRP